MRLGRLELGEVSHRARADERALDLAGDPRDGPQRHRRAQVISSTRRPPETSARANGTASSIRSMTITGITGVAATASSKVMSLLPGWRRPAPRPTAPRADGR